MKKSEIQGLKSKISKAEKLVNKIEALEDELEKLDRTPSVRLIFDARTTDLVVSPSEDRELALAVAETVRAVLNKRLNELKDQLEKL